MKNEYFGTVKTLSWLAAKYWFSHIAKKVKYISNSVISVRKSKVNNMMMKGLLQPIPMASLP